MNNHLDVQDQAIQANLCVERMKLIGKGVPLVGDVVLWPNNTKRRISHDWDDSLQTSFLEKGSFFIFSSGYASFSGGLQPPVLRDFLVKTEEVEEVPFWFFSHNRAGAGRGVICNVPVQVWRLEPFKRSREEAEKHPRAIASLEMNPRVLENPDHF